MDWESTVRTGGSKLAQIDLIFFYRFTVRNITVNNANTGETWSYE